MAGGAVADLGAYCINAARNLFGAEPTSVFARCIDRDGTDETTMVTMTFPDRRLAQFVVSNAAANVSAYRIAGSKGDLRVEAAFDYAGPLTHHLTLADGTKTTTFGERDQFAPELIYFSDCILQDREPEPSAEEGIADVRVIEAALTSARTGAPVTLPPFDRRRRPTLEQELHAPPVAAPDVVKAPGPSVR